MPAPRRRPLHNTRTWQQLRDFVRRRDQACTNCSSTDRLEVHHLHQVAEGGEELCDPSLLTLLCQPCHQLAHGKSQGLGHNGSAWRDFAAEPLDQPESE